jgi:hypothetical protein
MSRWYRAYTGTVTDDKLAEAALVAGCSRSVAIAGWHCLLESAANRNNCGSYDATPRRIAAVLCEPLATVEALIAAFDELGMTQDGAIASWKKRQFQSDDSKERVAKHRARKGKETPSDEDVTACNGDVTPPETEADTDKEVSSKDDRPSDDGPSLKPEHVFEGYQELAAQIGRPVPRDFTPERRQLVRGRISQYTLDDFQTVFARCRGSPFLRGDKGRTPLTFDWLMKKQNFQKTLEGNYE